MKTVVLSIPDSTPGETIPDKLATFLYLKFPEEGYGRWLAQYVTATWALRGLSWGPATGNQETNWQVTVSAPDKLIEELQRCAARL